VISWRASAATSWPSSRPTCATSTVPRCSPPASSRPSARPYEINGHRLDISTSIGLTLAPRDGTDADQLIKNADLALYRTKADGRNGYSFFKPEMNAHIQVRRKLETDLREALEREELALFYQPLVCLETRKVTGFEGLMRWTHPERGTIQPADFIALAEEAGLVLELGEWALRRACAQAARWPSPVKVSINLSPLQIKRDLIEVVLQALAASGLPPHRLELEITESVLLQDSQNTLATLHQLRQLGVRIVMDDFGRGYCSLSYLRSFPFDKIKIDRAFITDMDQQRPDAGAGRGHRRPRKQPRHGDRSGGRRELRAAGDGARLRLCRGAGLLLQCGGSAGRGRASAQ
jgi:predicted signal transduction protein with EAL and GGDEF domain